MFQMSIHSEVRAAQRWLTSEEVEYVLQFGKRFFSRGARVYYLRRKDLPRGDQRGPWARLVGTAVVTSLNRDRVITVWRNPREGVKLLRRKCDQRGRAAFIWPDDPLIDFACEDDGEDVLLEEAARLLWY